MNQRKLAVLGILVTLVVVFVAGLFAYQQHRRQATDEGAAAAGVEKADSVPFVQVNLSLQK